MADPSPLPPPPPPPLPAHPDLQPAHAPPPRPSTRRSGPWRRRQRAFDEDILDQHKTHVRRPPKGIQNWFDAYLDSDDGEDEDAEDALPRRVPPGRLADCRSPDRVSSHASEASSVSGCRGRERIHSDPRSVGADADADIARSRFHRTTSSTASGTSNSTQSSRQGRRRRRHESEARLASSAMAGESVLSLTESDFDDEGDGADDDDDDDDDDDHGDDDDDDDDRGDDDDHDDHDGGKSPLPPIRDSIINMDSGNFTIANASSIDVMRLPRPAQLTSARHLPPAIIESKPSPRQSTVPTPTAPPRPKASPISPHIVGATTADFAAPHRLDSLSYESAGTLSSSPSFRHVRPGSTRSENAHMMAVSDEERVLLDLMRRKRAAMQHLSFTEGYQLALQTEQERLAQHSASAEQRVLTPRKQDGSTHGHHASSAPIAPSPPTPGESDMRSQFGVIHKEHVDERFHLERFLCMTRPQPLSSHPPDPSTTVHLPRARVPSGDLLPSTRFSPTSDLAVSPIATSATEQSSGYCSAEDGETESARIRVRPFTSSNGAVPPLNSMKTVRRRSSRRPSSSIPPSPIAEEHAAPPVPQRSSDRPRTSAHSSDEAPRRKLSCLSVPEESRDWGASPLSASVPPNADMADTVHMQPPHGVSQKMTLIPPRTDSMSEPPEAFMKPRATQAPPHIGFSPFSSIIHAAAATAPKPSVRRVDSTQEPRDRGTALTSGGRKPLRQKMPLPPLNTFNVVDFNPRASMLSITSAGEEVLGAWAELGGGRDCLRTKRTSPPVVVNPPPRPDVSRSALTSPPSQSTA